MPDKYKKVIAKFSEKNGKKPIVLFAILKMDELVDKWSIVLSTDWIDEDNNKNAFNDLISVMQEELDSGELNEIARIVIYHRDEHLVELMLKQFREGQHIEEDARVNGNVIHEGYIISLNSKPSAQIPLSL